MSMGNELITVEYAGPASRQVGSLPWYDVRAWWVATELAEGLVKLAAGRELKKHVTADHVEFVHMDMDTYNHPHINAMLTFRVLTHEQFATRAELRARRYTTCDGCGCKGPSNLVNEHATGRELALCYTCWRPRADAREVGVLHWINRHGKLGV